jgi:ABC-type glycerol-3-phosphate transport system substrate-binding protein
MNIGGTNLRELINYEPGDIAIEGALGGTNIQSLQVDSNGDLWIAETGQFYKFNVPDDFTGEEWERWDYYESLGNVINVRKLDDTGAEILSVDVGDIFENEYAWLSAFSIDNAGNIFLAVETTIYVFDSNGNALFQLDTGSDWVSSLINLPDGSITYVAWGENGRELRKIDVAARAVGESLELPRNAWDVYPGGGEYLVIYHEGNGLFGVDIETGEGVRILNWLDSGIVLQGMDNVSLLPDGRVMCTNRTWDDRTFESVFELILLTRVPYADLPERISLSLATVWLNWDLRSQIVDFNNTNQQFRIHVIDYSEYNTDDDWNAGLTKLSTEIISGKVPDMLDVSNLPFNQYVARGLLLDLYPLIDSDPVLNRSDFVESVMRAAEMDGKLHRLFSSFSISTVIGHPSVVGPGMGWNMDEFRAVLDANPQADMPMGQWLTKDSFLNMAVVLGIDEYVDWSTGNVYFDTGAFAQLLEFANRFPENYDWDDGFGYIDDQEAIATGRQIMTTVWVGSFDSLQWYTSMYGGEVVFKGFPTENRNGSTLNLSSSLAITSRCNNPDGAWDFMRTFLTSEWQRENIRWNFPTNKAVFDAMAAETLANASNNGIMPRISRSVSSSVSGDIGWPEPEPEQNPITQEDINKIIELINSVSAIHSYDEAMINIITEGAADFFSGRSSANDAARIIQNRVSIYVSEQS